MVATAVGVWALWSVAWWKAPEGTSQRCRCRDAGSAQLVVVLPAMYGIAPRIVAAGCGSRLVCWTVVLRLWLAEVLRVLTMARRTGKQAVGLERAVQVGCSPATVPLGHDGFAEHPMRTCWRAK